MSNLKLSAKLPLYMAVLVLAAELVLGFVAYTKSSSQLVEASQDKLLALAKARRTALDDYLGIIREDIANMAENAQMVEAALDFQYTLEFGDKAEGLAKIRKVYHEDNKKGAELIKGDGSRYSKSHARNHPIFKKFIERRGYQDLIMIDATGDVGYTVRKGAEYATNLIEGEWKNSVLGKTFATIAKDPKPGTLVFTGFQPYAPDGGAPGGFIAAPMLDGEQFLGVLAFRMPIGRINDILTQPVGLGETGEAYIVGPDKLLRSNLRLEDQPTILKEKADIPVVAKALAGEEGVMVTAGLGGHHVVAGYGPVTFLGQTWALIAEIDEDEILAPVGEMRNFMIVATAVIMLLAVGAGMLISRTVAGAIARMTHATTGLAHGDLSIAVPFQTRKDEIGEMAGAVQVFKENAVKLNQVMAEQETASRRNQRRLKNEMFALTNALDEEVKSAIGIVLQQSEAMQEAAGEMSRAVEQSDGMSNAAAAASTDASSSVDAVAAAAEQLAGSIQEISSQVNKSSTIARKAVEEAEDTNAKIQGLAQAAQKIGEVVELITDIAEQTNLLALNATIEAARAGEAGKGFAVVASEVKNLANQTAKATEEIGSQIGGIQAATKEAVDAIAGIGGIISEVNEITTGIAAAIEEQTSATHNISENAQQAARSTQEASTNIGEVSQTTEQSGQHSREVQESAGEVRSRIRQMQESLETIMRAGTEDREINVLHTVNVAATLDLDGNEQACLLQDLSLAGVGVLDRKVDAPRGQTFRMTVPGIGSLSGVVVASTENSTHVRLDVDEGDMERVESFLSGRRQDTA